MRGHITKSKAGHYTVTIRDARGTLVSIHDRMPTLQAARELLSVLKAERQPVAMPSRTSEA